MAYHDAAAYIEKMQPGYVNALGEEFLRSKGSIRRVLATLDSLPGKVEWKSDARDLYGRRLKEGIQLLEGLHNGFEKAGKAVIEYAEAQPRARSAVAEGAAAEARLKTLIASIVATQSFKLRFSDALRQWNDLRGTTGASDWLIELPVKPEIEKVRPEADRLWHTAVASYDEAIRIETEARGEAVAQLRGAYRLLPDFLANSILAAQIATGPTGAARTPGKYRIGPPTRPELEFDEGFPYDPDARPTASDYASWAKWTGMLRGGQLFRPDLDDATAAYAHYLDGTGTPMRIDYEEAYREDPNIRQTVDNEIVLAQREAERIFRETGQTGFQMTGGPSKGEYPSTENWQKTLGDHVVYGTSDVVVHGNQITMKIKVHAEDVYNFNPGAADIVTGAPDDENGRFSTLGWAKGFPTHGEVERTVTWTIGDPGGAGGSTGPTRNAPGEDRVDGRQDGW